MEHQVWLHKRSKFYCEIHNLELAIFRFYEICELTSFICNGN